MLESSLKFIKCVNCNSKLKIQIYKKKEEIDEGILICSKCQTLFPIIDKIPIMFIDFRKYISEHKILSGKLYNLASSNEIKKFLKLSLNNIIWNKIDKTGVEERWSQIYNINKNNEFYKIIKSYLVSIPKSKLVLEYGCSIGILSEQLSNSNKIIFGIDKSFNAIQIAKQNQKNNIDYIVSEFTATPFVNKKFDLIVALNVLELMEPNILLKQISKQISSGNILISDPYDYERGVNSVKDPIDEYTVRKNLKKLKFKINTKTKEPSFIPWNLKLHDRASLNYKVDIVIAKK